jgi:hypothetical protein
MGTKPRTKPDVPAKIDLFKEHRNEYVAPTSPALVSVGEALYLAITGRGPPGGEEFQAKVATLYGAAYAIKMTRKSEGKGDYVVGKLEGQYWSDAGLNEAFDSDTPLNWRLMIRTPGVVSAADLAGAAQKLAAKGTRVEDLELKPVAEGRCVQMLHVGPYDQEAATVGQMLAFAQSRGLTYKGPHHEIYLSDPRRVAPDKLRTILRLPVA